MELAESKIEDIINSTFQVILYIFVFKMINVYNIARCESVQELQLRNKRVNWLSCGVMTVMIVTQLSNILLDVTLFFIEMYGKERCKDLDKDHEDCKKLEKIESSYIIVYKVIVGMRLLVDAVMFTVFTLMFISFIKNKRKAMNDKLIKWKCKHTMVSIFSCH